MEFQKNIPTIEKYGLKIAIETTVTSLLMK